MSWSCCLLNYYILVCLLKHLTGVHIRILYRLPHITIAVSHFTIMLYLLVDLTLIYLRLITRVYLLCHSYKTLNIHLV